MAVTSALFTGGFKIGGNVEKLIEIKPFAHLTETELAWAAGLIDGEGCITIAKSRPWGKQRSINYKMMLVVANTYEPAVERLQSMFGMGSIKKYSLGGNRKDIFQWTCHSEQAKTVVEAIRPYLLIKANDADILLEFSCGTKTTGWSERLSSGILAERERLYQLIRDGRSSCGNNGRRPKISIPDQELLV